VRYQAKKGPFDFKNIKWMMYDDPDLINFCRNESERLNKLVMRNTSFLNSHSDIGKELKRLLICNRFQTASCKFERERLRIYEEIFLKHFGRREWPSFYVAMEDAMKKDVYFKSAYSGPWGNVLLDLLDLSYSSAPAKNVMYTFFQHKYRLNCYMRRNAGVVIQKKAYAKYLLRLHEKIRRISEEQVISELKSPNNVMSKTGFVLHQYLPCADMSMAKELLKLLNETVKMNSDVVPTAFYRITTLVEEIFTTRYPEQRKSAPKGVIDLVEPLSSIKRFGVTERKSLVIEGIEVHLNDRVLLERLKRICNPQLLSGKPKIFMYMEEERKIFKLFKSTSLFPGYMIWNKPKEVTDGVFMISFYVRGPIPLLADILLDAVWCVHWPDPVLEDFTRIVATFPKFPSEEIFIELGSLKLRTGELHCNPNLKDKFEKSLKRHKLVNIEVNPNMENVGYLLQPYSTNIEREMKRQF
jgi:hypothetical protein